MNTTLITPAHQEEDIGDVGRVTVYLGRNKDNIKFSYPAPDFEYKTSMQLFGNKVRAEESLLFTFLLIKSFLFSAFCCFRRDYLGTRSNP